MNLEFIKKSKYKRAWSYRELCSFVDFYVYNVHKDIQSSNGEWSDLKDKNSFWTETSDFKMMY